MLRACSTTQDTQQHMASEQRPFSEKVPHPHLPGRTSCTYSIRRLVQESGEQTTPPPATFRALSSLASPDTGQDTHTHTHTHTHTPCRSHGFVILRACYRAQEPQNPENTKNIDKFNKRRDKNNPRLAPENEKIIQKSPKNDHFSIFSVVFFSYFRGANPGWGICIFFVFLHIFGVLGFLSCVAGLQDRNPG